MAQRLDTRWSGKGERLWLSLLVEAMEQASRPEIRAQPCESSVLKALRAQLAQPASRYPYAVSRFSLRN